MIIYANKGLAKYGILCRCRGSVLIRTIPWALVSAAIALVMSVLQWPECQSIELANNTCGMKHPAVFGWYFSLSTFMLAFNSSNAFGRYWEARTHLQTTSSQLTLIGSHVTGLCTPSLIEERKQLEAAIDPEEVKKIKGRIEAIAVFKTKFVHLLTLLHGMMTMYFLNTGWKNQKENKVEVLGGLTDTEREALIRCNDQVFLVESWLSELLIQGVGGNSILCKPPAPPIAAQFWALLHQVVGSFMGACKVEDTPFPYPYQQLIGLMSLVNTFMIPIFAVNITWDPTYSVLLSFVTSYFYRAIYETILFAEFPFGDEDNDLPFRLIHHQMVSRVRDLVDRDVHALLKEWNLIFAMPAVTVCRDGITTYVPFLNVREEMHDVMKKLERRLDDSITDDGMASALDDIHQGQFFRPEVHSFWDVRKSQTTSESMEAPSFTHSWADEDDRMPIHHLYGRESFATGHLSGDNSGDAYPKRHVINVTSEDGPSRVPGKESYRGSTLPGVAAVEAAHSSSSSEEAPVKGIR